MNNEQKMVPLAAFSLRWLALLQVVAQAGIGAI
jgi:hypothetical protein